MDPVEPDKPTGPGDPSDPDGPANPDEPTGPDAPDDDTGSLSAYGKERGDGYVQWTQSSAIDLFYNRTTGGQEKIAPGSSGYYLFRLQNTRSSQLNVTISFSEAGLHLPLAFTLTPLDSSGRSSMEGEAVDGSLTAGGGLALSTVVAGQAVAGYRLDWEWPAEGNDALDTKIGSGRNLAYMLTMKIHAEES